MTDGLLAYGRNALKTHGIVESGDALTMGVGAMTDARWAAFFRSMVTAGLYPAAMDYRKAYTLQFVGGGK
jgi:NitT/TauT family transport system substrate-binding protein